MRERTGDALGTYDGFDQLLNFACCFLPNILQLPDGAAAKELVYGHGAQRLCTCLSVKLLLLLWQWDGRGGTGS